MEYATMHTTLEGFFLYYSVFSDGSAPMMPVSDADWVYSSVYCDHSKEEI